MKLKDLELSQIGAINEIDDACARLKERYVGNGYLDVDDLKIEFCSIIISDNVMAAANEIANITGCDYADAVRFVIDNGIDDDIARFVNRKRGIKNES